MPRSALKPCTYPGCSTLVEHGRCKKHPPTFSRDPEVKQLYNSQRWRTLRTRQLASEPWCRLCLVKSLYTAATEVDHITPHRGDADMFFAGPFQSLCESCHSRKTAEEIGLSRPGKGGKKVLGIWYENATE